MLHYMNLQERPYAMIASGRKTVELRLLDEKRKKIAIGDTIIFKNAADEQATLQCTVKKLYVFESFEQLYQTLPLEQCGYLPEELPTASAKDMELYYSAQEQAKYGVVGIEIALK